MTEDNSIKELILQARNTKHLITEILNAYLLDTDVLEIRLKRQQDTEK